MATTEVETVETTRVPREQSLAHRERETSLATRGSGFALARMSDEDFTAVMELAKKGRQRLHDVMRSMMVAGVHYMAMPTKEGEPPRYNLNQAGASVLRKMFRLVPEPQIDVAFGDGVSGPICSARARVLMHEDSLDGPVVAIGVGECNTREKKYRWRDAQRACPECGRTTIFRSKKEENGDKGWFCWKKVDGCGAVFRSDDPKIITQTVGRVENPDQADLVNTVIKMAKKRATTDGTIEACDAWDLLTQDMEEQASDNDDGGAASRDAGSAPARSTPSAQAEKRPASAGTASASPSNGTAKPAQDAATDKQIAYLRTLAEKKLGARTDEAISMECVKRGAAGWPKLGKADAGRLIKAFSDMADQAGPSGPIQRPAAGMTRDQVLETIVKLADELDSLKPDARVANVFEKVEGVGYVLDSPNFLLAMACEGSRPLDSFTDDELKKLGGIIGRELRHAREKAQGVQA